MELKNVDLLKVVFRQINKKQKSKTIFIQGNIQISKRRKYIIELE